VRLRGWEVTAGLIDSNGSRWVYDWQADCLQTGIISDCYVYIKDGTVYLFNRINY